MGSFEVVQDLKTLNHRSSMKEEKSPKVEETTAEVSKLKARFFPSHTIPIT